MGKFGWSYPPGCSGTPNDEDDGVTELQESVLGLLEDAGIDAATNDVIMKLIDDAERRKWEAENAATAEEEAKPRPTPAAQEDG